VPFYAVLLAAALTEEGRREEAEQVIADLRTRHPTFESSAIPRIWPATEPSFVAGRDRIAARARELGLP
jgi:hypothetical protein